MNSPSSDSFCLSCKTHQRFCRNFVATFIDRITEEGYVQNEGAKVCTLTDSALEIRVHLYSTEKNLIFFEDIRHEFVSHQ